MLVSQDTFLNQINTLSGQQVQTCFHCHTCTAGCPLTNDMRFGPDRLLRLIELGDWYRTLTTEDIWLCAGCYTCTARCPNQIDVARVMDALRQMSMAAGFASPAPQITLFHRLYMGVVRILGRSHEAILLGLFKLRSFDLVSDLRPGLALFLKGKIPVLPRRFRGAASVRRIFHAAAQADQRRMQDRLLE